MYYIGYTSSISGGDSPLIFEYADWCYGAEEESADTVEYNLGYFFAGDSESEDYIIVADKEQTRRQLSAQYPTEDVINRSAVMLNFDEEASKNINQMWINIRCFNLSQITASQWRNAGIVIIVVAGCIALFALRKKIFRK